MPNFDDLMNLSDNLDRIINSRSKFISAEDKKKARSYLDIILDALDNADGDDVNVNRSVVSMARDLVNDIKDKVQSNVGLQKIDGPKTGPNIENILNNFSLVALSQASKVSDGMMSMDKVHPNSIKVVSKLLDEYDSNTLAQAYKDKYNDVVQRKLHFIDSIENNGSVRQIKQRVRGSLEQLPEETQNLTRQFINFIDNKTEEVSSLLHQTPLNIFDPNYKKRIYDLNRQFSKTMGVMMNDIFTFIVDDPNLYSSRFSRDKVSELHSEVSGILNDIAKIAVDSSQQPEYNDQFFHDLYQTLTDKAVSDPLDEESPKTPLSIDEFRNKLMNTIQQFSRN